MLISIKTLQKVLIANSLEPAAIVADQIIQAEAKAEYTKGQLRLLQEELDKAREFCADEESRVAEDGAKLQDECEHNFDGGKTNCKICGIHKGSVK